MRMVYLDKSGISSGEPYLVVAGVIITADGQWKQIEQYLYALRDKFIPESMRDGFIFHATEIYSGTKRFKRDEWSKDARWEILDQLVDIPRRFDLPVVCGFVRKAEFQQRLSAHIKTTTALAVNAQAVAFNLCAMTIQRWMLTNTVADEVALLIAEDNNEARVGVRSITNFNRNPDFSILDDDAREFLPLTRIIDTAHFAGKFRL